ncbi:MAG: hypothetical protein LVQ97_03845 [Candidatus Micrarchaeales archaeon]|jgi:carbamoyltransferase|nr:hypothetical protein [Candidatus Micrarchaeales archaeon]
MYVLGVWDGHDAGAALIKNDKIVYAANEERFTKRKLEVQFPYHSIEAALKYEGIKPGDVEHVAFSTTELTKTLERIMPMRMKEYYYLFRRRKIPKPRFEDFRHNLKYSMTGIGIVPFSTGLSKYLVARQLKHMGFTNFKLHVVEHHTAHAATAAFTSPFKKALVITVDGLGDGVSATISTFENKKLERHVTISATNSIGVFFEQVTNILGMRELEDEGKIMAMADYSYPFDFEDNKMKNFFIVNGTQIKARYSPVRQFSMLQDISWHIPREQTAFMAQQLLENVLVKMVSNAVDRFGIGDVVFAGGVLSNVKANMKIRNLENVKHWYVFPHMGDGGIALGSAMYANYGLSGSSHYDFGAYLGQGYEDSEIEQILKKDRQLRYQYEPEKEVPGHAADLITEGNYVFWFQGRMEYGPRALGDRSILAQSDSVEVKDRLNMYVKKREWFQPFAPSMLEEEAGRLLEYDDKGIDKYMTMAYKVREGFRDVTKSVVNVDWTCRPQMVGDENPKYRDLIRKVEKKTSYGIVLNTSFNLHGFPIVMSPADAIETMKKTNTKYMFLNGFFVTNRKGV